MTEIMTEETAVDTRFEEFLLQDTGTLDLQLPNGKPMLFEGKQVKAHMFGPGTAAYSRAELRQKRSALFEVIQAAADKNKINGTDKGEEVGTDDDELQFLIDVTSHFENFPYPGGAEAVLKNRRFLYIRKQLAAYMKNMGNFLKG